MFFCISIGIGEYMQQELTPIPCACRDAKRVYSTFHKAMNEEFDDFASLCLTNIKADDFELMLKLLAREFQSREDPDLMIGVYFSGNAEVSDRKLRLFFKNYDGQEGYFEANRIKEIFEHFSNRILLILDCCSAGRALNTASDITGLRSELSVLAACGPFQTAKYDENSSFFTRALCNSIEDILSYEDSFTLGNLLKYMKEKYHYTDVCVNRGASNELNIEFKPIVSLQRLFPGFAAAFVKKQDQNNVFVREAMWYSLNELPVSTILEVCTYYFTNDRPVEASWLVRRAIGSTLANHVYHPDIKRCLLRLLKSDYWQEQCIALVGLRYVIGMDKEVFDKVLHDVSSQRICRIDAVWLANLYSSDNPNYTSSHFENTQLVKTSWGAIELPKTQLRYMSSEEALEFWRNSEFYPDVKKEYDLVNNMDEHVCDLWKSIYKQPLRGRFPQNTKGKFLLSIIYGNWREQVVPSFQSFFETHETSKIETQLESMSVMPSAERRMALFSYFHDHMDYARQFAEHIIWGLSDTHPWVRRTAAELFSKLPEYEQNLRNCFFDMCNNVSYPGILDFYLTCPPKWQGDLIKKIVNDNILIRGDLISLKAAFN